MENNENIESIGQSEETAAEKRKDILCELVADKQYVPMKEKELAMLMQVPREERGELHRLLDCWQKGG